MGNLSTDLDNITLDLDEKATEQLWVSLSLEGGGLSNSEKEKMIREAFDVNYNRPEYNSWHKFNRHRGSSKAQSKKTDGEKDADTSEPLMNEVADDRIFRKDEPEWADAFIAVRMDGDPIREYAARIGADENNITQKLKRAEKRLADAYHDFTR